MSFSDSPFASPLPRVLTGVNSQEVDRVVICQILINSYNRKVEFLRSFWGHLC